MKNKSIDELREELRSLMSEDERIKELELQVLNLEDVVRSLDLRLMRVETPRYVHPPIYGRHWSPPYPVTCKII